MSTTQEHYEEYEECEKHELFNCFLCLHPTKARKPYHWREPSAVGTTKAEVLAEVATTVGLPPPVLSTAGELVPFWTGLLQALGLGLYPGNPADAAHLVALLGEKEWDDACATSPHHVSLRGLIRVRDAVTALHKEHRDEHST